MDPNQIDLSQMPDVNAAPMSGPPALGTSPSNPLTGMPEVLKRKPAKLSGRVAKILTGIDPTNEDAVTQAEQNYIATTPEERAREASRKYWLQGEYGEGKSKLRLWGERIGKGLLEGLTAFGEGRQYQDPYNRAFDKAMADYKVVAPEFQKDISGRDAAQAKQYAAQAQLTGRQAMAAAQIQKTAMNNLAISGLRGAQAKEYIAKADEITAMVASGKLEAQAAQIKLENLNLEHFGSKNASPDIQASMGAKTQGPDFLKPAADLAFQKQLPGLAVKLAGTSGIQNTPVQGIDKNGNPTTTWQQLPTFHKPNINMQDIMGLRGQQSASPAQQAPQNPFLPQSMQPQGGQGQIPPSPPQQPIFKAPPKAPIEVPASVGKPKDGVNGKKTPLSDADLWLTEADFGKTGDRQVTRKPKEYLAQNVMGREAEMNSTRQLLNSVIQRPYEDIVNARRWETANMLTGGLASKARSAVGAVPFSEADLRANLGINSLDNIMKYGGKRPNAQEVNIVKETMPSMNDSAENLVKKVFKRALVMDYYDKKNHGDNGKTTYGVKVTHHGTLDKEYFKDLNNRVETLFNRYKAGRLDASAFDSMPYIQSVLEDVKNGK